MNRLTLKAESAVFKDTGGVSANNGGCGFRPAFLDTDTHRVYLSRFGDGRPAPMHLLDGLPEDVVVARGASGRVAEVKSSVVAGFVRDGRFYTREQAARAVATVH